MVMTWWWHKPDVSPLDFVEAGGNPDVIETPSDGGDCAVDEEWWLGVDVDAVEILRLVDRPQQPLRLLHVREHSYAEGYRKLRFLDR